MSKVGPPAGSDGATSSAAVIPKAKRQRGRGQLFVFRNDAAIGTVGCRKHAPLGRGACFQMTGRYRTDPTRGRRILPDIMFAVSVGGGVYGSRNIVMDARSADSRHHTSGDVFASLALWTLNTWIHLL